MKKINLTDVTFTIPVRIDSEQRKRNLEIVVKYLNTHFDTNILVGEESKSPDLKYFETDCDYIHYQTDDSMMRRTHVLNLLAREANTPIIVNYDTDVLLPIKQYVNSAVLIRKNEFDMVYPYDGRFLNVKSDDIINSIATNMEVDNIPDRFLQSMRTDSVGGAIFWNKEKFIEGGMENENFVSWGYEDDERLIRFKKLGFRISRWPGVLYHLNHPSSPNSASVHKFYSNNKEEFERIRRMNKEQILEYMKEWPWLT